MVAGLLPASSTLAADYEIDPNHTFPGFSISHLGFSTIRGQFDRSSGAMVYDPAERQADVRIEIDAASIDTGLDRRDDHLRSPDFLNVAEYPTIIFESTSATWEGDHVATVEGELTMVGVTRPVMLAVTAAKCGANPMNQKEMCGFDAETTIKRSEFGIDYGLPAIGDEMALTFGVEAIRQ
jgi:polyisoprenoid-binding protein YceI